LDGGDQGLILRAGEKQELFGSLNEGFEKGVKFGLNMVTLGSRDLLGSSVTPSNSE
jgi:hypothetical protein